jgi:MinD-like ATPase involved in chromosome partitioning or flagellar assembly
MDKAKLITIWSAHGSPGRTTIALALAAELAESGKRVFLLDADTYAPSINLMLALVDHPAGLAAACRLVGQERFDFEQLQRLSTQVAVGKGQLTVMTGLSSESRWAEVSSEKLDDLLMVAGENFDFMILDVSAGSSEGLQSLNSSVDRNAVTRWAIGYSDFVIAICAADPVGVSRFLEAMVRLTEIKPTGQVLTLVNRLRTSVLGSAAKQQIIDSLSRLGQITVAGFVPDDPSAADSAIKSSLPIGIGRRASQARQSISLFCRAHILGQRSKLDGRLIDRANR